LGTAHSAPYIHTTLQRFGEVVGGGWPCWALSNHDVVRVATRWGGAAPAPGLLRLAAALQMSLRGSPCLYQGDELGLPEADLAFEDLRDPYGITMWPEFKGRDGCRTPMPWSSQAADLGFAANPSSVASPWLPVSETHRALAVDVQEKQADSLLHFYRNLLQWRKTQAALIHGDMTLMPVHEQVLAYVRTHESDQVLCLFNFSDADARWAIPAGVQPGGVLMDSGLQGARVEGVAVHLAPWGGAFIRLL
jgi:alpha-glucosidase